MAEKAIALATRDYVDKNTVKKSGDTFTGTVTHNASTNFNASTYMKNGVGYNAYDSNGNACILMALSFTNNLMIGSDSYPHSGNTYIKAPTSDSRVILDSGNVNMYFTIDGTIYSTGDATEKACVLRFLKDGSTVAFRCQGDGTTNLGGSSTKWKNVYATNGQIQTSDRNFKKNIKDIDDRYIQLFDMVRPVSYQLIKGDRIHTGFIAQEVEDAMKAVGLTAEEIGFFCKDIKVVQDPEDPEKDIPVLDENGNPVYIYSLRYEEYIAITAEKVRRHENRINQLEIALEKLIKHGEE